MYLTTYVALATGAQLIFAELVVIPLAVIEVGALPLHGAKTVTFTALTA
ncbi:hypothetical protein ACFOEQ_14265 [Chryseobacterium arachidis]